MAPWLRFQDTNFKCIRSIPYPNTKAHFEDKSWSHSGQWCLNSPPCLLPLHVWWGIPWDKAKPWQYCLPPPQERDWYQKEICTVSCRNRWAPCCSTIYQRGEKAPTGCALCPPVQHLSEAALSHHLPPFTSQHSRKRQSQAFPWRSAWLQPPLYCLGSVLLLCFTNILSTSKSLAKGSLMQGWWERWLMPCCQVISTLIAI